MSTSTKNLLYILGSWMRAPVRAIEKARKPALYVAAPALLAIAAYKYGKDSNLSDIVTPEISQINSGADDDLANRRKTLETYMANAYIAGAKGNHQGFDSALQSIKGLSYVSDSYKGIIIALLTELKDKNVKIAIQDMKKELVNQGQTPSEDVRYVLEVTNANTGEMTLGYRTEDASGRVEEVNVLGSYTSNASKTSLVVGRTERAAAPTLDTFIKQRKRVEGQKPIPSSFSSDGQKAGGTAYQK